MLKENLTDVAKTAAAGGSSASRPVVVIGGGPAGLTAAYELHKCDPAFKPIVFEGSDQVGGISRTVSYKGYRFDIGGHRFFTKVGEVNQMWDEVVGSEMIDVPRSSRIFYNGKYYDYPLKLMNTLQNLGVYESTRVMLSYLKRQVWPLPVEDNFEQWVTNRFGGRLFWHFFKTYTEKVWGLPCKEIRADWAAQRIKNLSLMKAVMQAVSGKSDSTSLISTFKYPRLGPGQMWEMCADRVTEQGGEVRMQQKVTGLHWSGSKVTHVDVEPVNGEPYTVAAEYFINTMAMSDLIFALGDKVPEHVQAAAKGLKYRDFLIVTLILDHADPFPDNWIYIHSPEVKVGRIQNFRAWSQAMVPEANRASIGMEYFCQKGDGLWLTDDADLIKLAGEELEKLGLAPKSSVIDGTIIRQPRAYPVYDADYKVNVDTIQDWISETFTNLQTVGRNAMHRYNNQDHSMLAAILAARNVAGEQHDVWNVNVERSYHEEFVVKQKAA